MEAIEVMREMIQQSGGTPYSISIKMGRTYQYLNSTLSRNSVPRTDIYAEVADACGYDLVVRRRVDGTEITIDRGQQK